MTETLEESRQDLVLGACFLLITVFSSIRVFRTLQSNTGRKVVPIFNFLIFLTAFSRAVWFLLPNDWLEPSYAPTPIKAFHSNSWLGILMSELLLETGSLSLYGVFILIACYWAHMLSKLENVHDSSLEEANDESLLTRISRLFNFKSQGTIQMFLVLISVVLIVQSINVVLFLCQVFNSDQMILYDSIFLSILSLAIVIQITMLSNKIKQVLSNLEAINQRNSQPQIRRIYAIILVANVFFITKVVLECTLAACFIGVMREDRSVSIVVNDKFWSLYIILKHTAEIILLTLELLISTAIRAYDTSGVATRHKEQLTQQQQQQPSLHVNQPLHPALQSLKDGPQAMKITSSSSTSSASGAAKKAYGGLVSDRSSIGYHKVPNYSSMEMANSSSEVTPIKPTTGSSSSRLSV